ncbi:flagellar hook-length control protein FliK [Campylobacter helveticus]|uniref:flagellar hook-length control protein FliK n=1 Tax=Campylobacter helveticus TaxID=28898 RepID=UPI0009D8FB72|nr:flagellar hook-length control protein FliK [Campylobacter helveticus]TNB64318.1 flagellar hook-length control protein FliK [Campylobacter helveticus]TNH34408.1 flagellar hook-length control protein FliK [Campylobacter helveticus]TNH36648.1 flagellar hook-length control protein FliK [Campylobacter helveticus]TXK57005.1 flagellar hook-length control protein FliK [Campylobacter helveticus]SMC20674.1 Flagellar hook-length control protein FliK [Campylobacter helveticus]
MSNLAPQSEVLNLAPSKNTNQASFSKNVKNNQKEEASSDNERESFLNSLLASIEETNEHLPQHMKISEAEVVGEVMSKLQVGNFDEGDKISIFESASLMQILSVLDKLKTDMSNVKLANLANNNNNALLQLIKNENNFNALKNANSLGELLDLAKDMGLEVRDIKVDRLLDLKATFPNLDKKEFFKGAIDNVFKEILNNKLAHIEKNLDKNLQTNNKVPKKTNEANSLLSKTLQNLDTLIKKEDKSKKENNEEVEIKLNTKNHKNENFSEILEGFSKKTKISENDEKKTRPALKEETIKEVNLENKKETFVNKKEPLKEVKEETIKEVNLENKKETFVNKKEPLKEVLDKEILNTQEKTKSPLKEAVLNATLNSKEMPKETAKEAIIKEVQKDLSKESLKDMKLNRVNSEGMKVVSENLTKIVQNKNNENAFGELLNKETNKEFVATEKSENVNVEKSSMEDLNNLVKDLSRVNQNQKIVTPKETLQYFSQDLKEAMEQYKAPITKLSITLNPSNLGEVEVTLVQRGANLHINFNSNPNAMNLFIQHQAEFKNSLVNMGFTGLEMNFSEQGKREQQQEKKSKSHYYDEKIDEESSPKINLELVLAKYF